MTDYASQEELYFSWYLEELQASGYIKSWKFQPEPFIITPPVRYNWEKDLKTKTKIVESEFLKKYQYTADFLIVWNLNVKDILFQELIFSADERITFMNKIGLPFIAQKGKKTGKMFSVIDVKGTYSQNDAYSRFSKDKKLVWHIYRIYINKIIPAPSVSGTGVIRPKNALFYTTFIPNNFRFTPTGKLRKINFPHQSLQEFIKQQTNDSTRN